MGGRSASHRRPIYSSLLFSQVSEMVVEMSGTKNSVALSSSDLSTVTLLHEAEDCQERSSYADTSSRISSGSDSHRSSCGSDRQNSLRLTWGRWAYEIVSGVRRISTKPDNHLHVLIAVRPVHVKRDSVADRYADLLLLFKRS